MGYLHLDVISCVIFILCIHIQPDSFIFRVVDHAFFPAHFHMVNLYSHYQLYDSLAVLWLCHHCPEHKVVFNRKVLKFSFCHIFPSTLAEESYSRSIAWARQKVYLFISHTSSKSPHPEDMVLYVPQWSLQSESHPRYLWQIPSYAVLFSIHL